jgi:hypothetical protein
MLKKQQFLNFLKKTEWLIWLVVPCMLLGSLVAGQLAWQSLVVGALIFVVVLVLDKFITQPMDKRLE